MKIFPTILLGSQSPRRRELLEQAGFNTIVKVKSIDESFPQEMPHYQVAVYLAQQKSYPLRDEVHQDQLLLTADSVVVVDDKIFNKPEDRAEAYQMIRSMAGKSHLVFTGVCLFYQGVEVLINDCTKVHFNDFTDEEIYYYIDTFKPYDKAGAYGIQDWIGLCKVKEIEGTYTNVMGLPVHRVYEEIVALINK